MGELVHVMDEPDLFQNLNFQVGEFPHFQLHYLKIVKLELEFTLNLSQQKLKTNM